MKRLLLTLMLLIALFGASSTLAPRLAHASITRAQTYTASCDTRDSGGYPYFDGTQNYLGYNVEGNACVAWDPNYVPPVCQQAGGAASCWDVAAATNVSPSVYQTYADAGGYDQCGTGEWVQEMYQGRWLGGSESLTTLAYGSFQNCGQQAPSHYYQVDYGHFFESSSSSGSYGWTSCEETC
jgi:hypothetical protein